MARALTSAVPFSCMIMAWEWPGRACAAGSVAVSGDASACSRRSARSRSGPEVDGLTHHFVGHGRLLAVHLRCPEASRRAGPAIGGAQPETHPRIAHGDLLQSVVAEAAQATRGCLPGSPDAAACRIGRGRIMAQARRRRGITPSANTGCTTPERPPNQPAIAPNTSATKATSAPVEIAEAAVSAALVAACLA
jgi:hypothetical protein